MRAWLWGEYKTRPQIPDKGIWGLLVEMAGIEPASEKGDGE